MTREETTTHLFVAGICCIDAGGGISRFNQRHGSIQR